MGYSEILLFILALCLCGFGLLLAGRICMLDTIRKPLVEAAFGRKPSRQPVWFLRQAGRYLPEYREIRKGIEFVDLCKNPKLAAEVTIQPLRRFDLDAAIIFSDILIPPTAMGQTLTFGKGHGPMLSNPIRDSKDLKKLEVPDCGRALGYVGDAIQETKRQLGPEQAMIGFAGAPFTVSSYMIEGHGTKTYTELKRLMYRQPETFKGLLEILAEVTVNYLAMQVQAGAEVLMLFDTWVGNIAPSQYRSFVAPVMELMIKQVKRDHPDVPIIYYPGQGSEMYPEIRSLSMDVVAVDWRVDLGLAVDKLKANNLDVSVQGNLDPQLFEAPLSYLQEAVWDILAKGKTARGHIFNVGHGLLPHLDPEAIGAVVKTIRDQE